MHDVYVCFGCRVPLTEGSYGVFCCELCQVSYKKQAAALVEVAARRHTEGCIQRLREVLDHTRKLLERPPRDG
jgi:ribosomal protein L37AE/L43A